MYILWSHVLCAPEPSSRPGSPEWWSAEHEPQSRMRRICHESVAGTRLQPPGGVGKGILEEECSTMLKEFFKALRKRKSLDK